MIREMGLISQIGDYLRLMEAYKIFSLNFVFYMREEEFGILSLTTGFQYQFQVTVLSQV